MPRVTFYETTDKGSKATARITLKDDGSVSASGNKSLADLLFDQGQETHAEKLKAMKAAPQRFDGAYLRAAYEE